jgi:hypothetical protein
MRPVYSPVRERDDPTSLRIQPLPVTEFVPKMRADPELVGGSTVR